MEDHSALTRTRDFLCSTPATFLRPDLAIQAPTRAGLVKAARSAPPEAAAGP